MNIPTTQPTPFTLYEELPEPIFQDMKDREAEKEKEVAKYKSVIEALQNFHFQDDKHHQS